jgi:hypothetical protein
VFVFAFHSFRLCSNMSFCLPWPIFFNAI